MAENGPKKSSKLVLNGPKLNRNGRKCFENGWLWLIIGWNSPKMVRNNFPGGSPKRDQKMSFPWFQEKNCIFHVFSHIFGRGVCFFWGGYSFQEVIASSKAEHPKGDAWKMKIRPIFFLLCAIRCSKNCPSFFWRIAYFFFFDFVVTGFVGVPHFGGWPNDWVLAPKPGGGGEGSYRIVWQNTYFSLINAEFDQCSKMDASITYNDNFACKMQFVGMRYLRHCVKYFFEHCYTST